MSEASMKATLVKKLSGMDAVSIESPRTGLGIPDVNFTLGWIECKALKAWPKGADTRPVRFPHPLTKEQQIWLYRREKAGGLALVCGKVSNLWFFWSGLTIKEHSLWNNMTRPEMYRWALRVMGPGLDKRELEGFLRSEFETLQSANFF